MKLRIVLLGLLVAAFSIHPHAWAAALAWQPIGPDGGDARSFATDPANPRHIYLGTLNSWIYQSEDGGQKWERLSKVGSADDLVVDSITADSVDPRTLVAGVWRLDKLGGGIYISHDAGATWTPSSDMLGQSVRALAQSPSDSKIYVAGTLSGIYRSQDGGIHWKQISPPGSGEIREVESIAIDPTDPNTIYAGTWHLPWKTTDGGAHWTNIKQGLIDDSDVFSIIIDPTRPSVVYASACSGIYRSDNYGDLFRKVQGIPSTARRTRVLMQDPVNRSIVYAGTTEGLYKTTDGGVNWSRITGPDRIINDVYIDPKNPQHVLLATDRGGVLASDNAGASFEASNAGFSQRQVSSLLVDAKNNQTMYAGVVNDKQFGGVFTSTDGGSRWSQQSAGLDGRDVFSLAQSADGTLLAGTRHGIFRWNGTDWQQDGNVVNTAHKTVYTVRRGRRTKKTIDVAAPAAPINAGVNQISTGGNVWYAATSEGIYRSMNQGSAWQGPLIKGSDYLFVDAQGGIVIAARHDGLMLSEDGGLNWRTLTMPATLSSVRALATSPNGTLWVGGREGLFLSDDRGQTWHAMSTLPIADIDGLTYDAAMKRMIVTSSDSTLVFAINEADKSWKWWDAGWNVRHVRSTGGRLVAASLYDGVVVQPAPQEAAATHETRR